MAFGDADGIINVLSAAEDDAGLPFNGFEGHPIEWADSPEKLQEIEWSDTTYVILSTNTVSSTTNLEAAH